MFVLGYHQINCGESDIYRLEINEKKRGKIKEDITLCYLYILYMYTIL